MKQRLNGVSPRRQIYTTHDTETDLSDTTQGDTPNTMTQRLIRVTPSKQIHQTHDPKSDWSVTTQTDVPNARHRD